jgi:hypothetical protein
MGPSQQNLMFFYTTSAPLAQFQNLMTGDFISEDVPCVWEGTGVMWTVWWLDQDGKRLNALRDHFINIL